MLVYEAGSSFGQASARTAMEEAVKRAKTHGICMLGLRNANHIGRVGTYGEVATAAGMVSLHFVNVCGCTHARVPIVVARGEGRRGAA